MDDKKSLLTTLPPLLVAAGTLITAVIGLGNFMSTPVPSITEFDVSPSIIDPGGNATLKWAVSGEVAGVSIDPGIGVVALSGIRQVSPANTTNYILTAKNKDKAKTASAQLVVRDAKAVLENRIQESNIEKPVQSAQPGQPAQPAQPGQPAQSSVPTPAKSNIGDEPVQMGGSASMNTVKIILQDSAPTNTGDEPATIGESKIMPKDTDTSKSANAPADAGDEPIPVSESKIMPKNADADMPNSVNNVPENTGDEPIPTGDLNSTEATVNSSTDTSTEINTTVANTTTKAAASSVGDVA